MIMIVNRLNECIMRQLAEASIWIGDIFKLQKSNQINVRAVEAEWNGDGYTALKNAGSLKH
jgi:hypothetical protein